MPVRKKAVLVATLAVVVGIMLYEASVIQRQNSDLAEQRQRSEDFQAEATRLRLQVEATARQLKSVEDRIDVEMTTAAGAGNDAALAAEMKAWLERLDTLKQALAQRPQFAIPELALLDEDSWLQIARNGRFETDQQLRTALAQLRGEAEGQMAGKIAAALSAYLAAHDNQLPEHIAQLLPFFAPPIESAWLQRYEMMYTGRLSDLPPNQKMNLVQYAPADPDFDSLFEIGANSYGSGGNAAAVAVEDAQKEYARTHDGARATQAEELVPYLKWPVSAAKVEETLARFRRLSR
jgi:hypothetical protein